MEVPPKKRELSTEEVQDAQIGLLEWELEERDKQHGIDHLTGADTRKVFEAKLEQALESVRLGEKEHRKGVPQEVSLISIDIDHFKAVNDTLGHPAGDEVLRRVTGAIMSSVRETDAVGRIGGEELMVFLPGASVEAATKHAEELRAKIEQLTFDKYPDLKVTASFGVISSDVSSDAKTLVEYVDRALYVAKRGGRNRVELYK
jgi:diguanylate cyclase (GGDEF)-like protein